MSAEHSDHKQRKNIIKVVVISAAFLLLIALIGVIAAAFSYTKWQSNEYWAVDVARVALQGCGLETKNLNDAPKNQTIIYHGVMKYIDGANYDKEKKLDNAIASYREALNEFQAYPGWNNMYAFNSLMYLGADLEKKLRYEEAEKCYRDALECAKRFTSSKSFLVSHAKGSLGVYLNKHKKSKEACAVFQSIVDIDKAGLGADHNSVGYDYEWLADSQSKCGDFSDAVRSLDAAEKILKKPDDALDLKVMRGIYLYNSKQYSEAIEALRAAETVAKEIPPTLSRYRGRLYLAYAYRDNDQLDLAEEAAFSAVPPPNALTDNSDYTSACLEAAEYFSWENEFERSESIYRNTLATLHQRAPNDLLDSTRVKAALASCLRLQKKNDS